MDSISPELRENYLRWLEKIENDPYKGSKTVGITDVLRAHYLIIDYFVVEYGEGVGGIGPKNFNLLHSTLSRQTSGFDSYSKWSNDLEICATLFWGLIKNHAFHDANKRTAFLTLLYHLRKIKRIPSTKQKEFENLAVRIASNELDKYGGYSDFKKRPDPEIQFIAHFLKRNTRPVDKTEYLITYNDLDTILRKYSFCLENPQHNRIDVVRISDERKGILDRRIRQVKNRVCTIGFPGWKKQVNVGDIKKVRKVTNLTVDNGVDSESFFRGTDSLATLITHYQNPLKRLADK